MSWPPPTGERVAPFLFSDDPENPCGYCVGWREEPWYDDGPEPDSGWPIDAKGRPVPWMWRGTQCDASVADYLAEVENRLYGDDDE